MLTGLLRLLSKLPLRWLHGAGTVLGWLTYRASPSYANRLRENLARAELCHNSSDFKALLRKSIKHAGKAMAELPAVWFRPQEQSAAWVRKVNGWDVIERARAQGRGIIIMAPHIGCFEVIPQYLSLRFPFTALYRPPRFTTLEPAMRAGRERPDMRLATTDVKGVRVLLKALRQGEAIGILPDQVPGAGDGEWADFFGRPAYTMTLWSRLAERSGAPVVLMCALRLPKGQGYELTFESMPAALENEPPARQLNRALETMIRRCPEQYMWSYNRYKGPVGILPPVSASEHGDPEHTSNVSD